MAKTDWQMGDTVKPDDLNQIGQEINENADAITDHVAATTGVHGATSAATPNTIVQRDSAGRFKAAAPSAADDVARKAEVDTRAVKGPATEAQINDPRSTPSGIYDIDEAVSAAIGLSPQWHHVIHMQHRFWQGGYSSQIAVPFSSGAPKYRQADGPSWGPWVSILSDSGGTVKGALYTYGGIDVEAPAVPPGQVGMIFANGANGRLYYHDLNGYQEVFHTGNDGAGSGLDADTVRGYVPVNKNGDTMTNDLIIDHPANGNFSTLRVKNMAQVIDIGAYYQAGVTQFAQIQAGDTETGSTQLLRLNPHGGLVSINDFEAWHAGNFPYEAGNWTPNVEIGGINASYASRSGTYIRIRDLVYWTFHVELSSKNGGTGSIAIGAFPFPIAPANGIIPMGKITSAAFPSGIYWAHLRVPWDRATFFYLQASGSISGNYFLTGNHISDNSILAASGVCRILP